MFVSFAIPYKSTQQLLPTATIVQQEWHSKYISDRVLFSDDTWKSESHMQLEWTISKILKKQFRQFRDPELNSFLINGITGE